MSTRYRVRKTGYINEDNTVTEGKTLTDHNHESDALAALKLLDEDWHFIERETYQKITGNYYDWETDEEYGNNGKRWISDFTEKELA